MKKSNQPHIRINRAVKELTKEGNKFNIGTVLFEEIIRSGIIQLKEELEKLDRTKNHIIHPAMYERTLEILEKHLNLN